MATTNVPAIQWTATGPVLPSEAAILAGVQADMNAAFGGNLNPALNTPQGQLATSLSAIIADANATVADFVNGVNPSTSNGFMQDAIGQIYYTFRNPGLPTTVTCTCVGLAGTVIPVGAQAVDTSRTIYVCTAAVTIPTSGTITTTFASSALGPLACPANTLNQIYLAIPGWDTVNNAADGVVGANVETPAEFEYRRAQSVAANAQGSVQAVYGAVFAVPNVIDAYIYENSTGSAVNVGSTTYSVAAHSIYVAVSGGASAAIANAIWTKKSPGCDMNGNTSVTVTDANYSSPQPSYTIKYETPTATPVYFAVTLATATGLPSNYTALIQNAIAAQFNGTNGSARARIGATILAANYYGPILALGPAFQLSSVFVGLASSPTATSVTLGIDEAPTLIAADITVAT